MAEIGCKTNPHCTFAAIVNERITELQTEYDEAVAVRENTFDIGNNMRGAKQLVRAAQEKRDALSIELAVETARCDGKLCAVALNALQSRIEQAKKGY